MRPDAPRSRSLFGARIAAYLTNHVVAHVPSFTFRHWWYRRVLGVALDARAHVHIGCTVWFFGRRSIMRSSARVGSGTWVGRRCVLDFRGPLTIGRNVSIAPEVALITAQHDKDSPEFALECKPVIIEDNVWIGFRATVLPGARIRQGAVVAAGAVVTGEVEPLSVVAGVPARVVGRRRSEAARYDLDSASPWFE